MTQQMKKLLKEFKSYLEEESKIADAYSVLKLFVDLGAEPNTPQAEVISNIQNILNFSDRYKEAPTLSGDNPRDVVIAQEKISNKYVKDYIVDLLAKNGLPMPKITEFMNYVSQEVEGPEEVSRSAAEYNKEKQEQEQDVYEIGDDDIAPPPPQQNKTVSGRKAKPSTPEDSMLARYRKAADDGSKTGF